ncbi:MAG: transposase [Candidatus Azotimanducaceae bacterium]|jgi:transposase
MLRPGEDVDVCLYADSVEVRKSINGLTIIVGHSMVLPTNSGALFVFCNRDCDKIKILCWERNGFIVWYKRLERQRFSWPKIQDTLSISGRELNWLLEGFDLLSNQLHKTLHFDSVS